MDGNSSSNSSMSATGTEHGTCVAHESSTFFTSSALNVLLVLSLCKITHSIGILLQQPRLVTEFLVGYVLGTANAEKAIHIPLEKGFRVMEGFSSTLYMFVLGLEMEPLAILRSPGPEANIAYAGILSTWTTITIFYLMVHHFDVFQLHATQLSGNRLVLAAFAVVFSATSSPVITRLITELKLGQSEIGRRAIRAGLANDLVCTIILCVLLAYRQSNEEILIIALSITAEMIFIVFVMRFVFRWVDKRNPEGKNMRGLDMTLIVISTQLLCHIAKVFHYDTKMNAFLIGLALPRHGRVSNFLISKINYILTTFILPLYVSMVGMNSNIMHIGEESAVSSVRRMAAISTVAVIGKILGTLVVSMHHGLHWLEAVTLGIILNMKGYYHLFFSMHAKNRGLMSNGGFLVMSLMVVSSISYVPYTVSYIIQRVRKIKGGKPRLMGLQWYNPVSELRLTIGLHRPQNVLPSMSLVEMMRAGSDAGTIVYAMDMVELTEQSRAALVYKQGSDAVMVADNEIIELREQIRLALDAHLEANGEGITLIRSLAISSFSGMHEDICCSAQDSLTAFIVLPFHKSQKSDGGMDDGHPGFRTVNENVLQHAACSVGILVDRGLGQNNKISTSAALINVVVLFIGGADDREALAFAGIIAHHPAIRLLVFRIMQDIETTTDDSGMLAARPQRKIGTEVDDEYFDGFYEHFVTNGSVDYMGKHVRNGAEVVKMLRELEGEYQLYIVGQGSKRNSPLTAGLSEWAECPELGPIGDILAASDFNSTASVLVIQQHNPARGSDYISDEFMPL